MVNSEFLKKAKEAAGGVKRQETILPIACKSAVVSPLFVGDDVDIRSSLSSPVNYDRDLVSLLHKHTQITFEDQTKMLGYDEFISSLSNIDKTCLLWALYKSTYETLGSRKITCTGDNCKKKFEDEILLDQLIQEDTFHPWEEDLPFYDYAYPIVITYNDWVYQFNTRIPSIKDNNRVLSMISQEALQYNLEKIGAIFAKPERMLVLTKEMYIKHVGAPDDSASYTNNPQEIAIACKNHVPQNIGDDFFSEYDKKFTKYIPKFYKKINCPNCGTVIEYTIDMEIEFFRRSL